MGGIINSTFAPSSDAKPKRLYQVWKGRNKFCCGGRLVFGPDAASLLLSTCLIGVPAITFCIKMLLKISETNLVYGYVVLIIGISLTILDLIFLFLTSASDPGIVPRNPPPLEPDESTSVTTESLEWLNSTTPDLKLPKIKEVVVDGHAIKIKYCDTCFLYRPPRASHCSTCNNCVQRFDHHCPWVGQCIGIRNYWSFILFIFSSTILCVYIFTFSLLNILQEEGNLRKIMARDFISVILVVYCFIAVWFVGGLCVLHLFLICSNKTTYESFRHRYDKKKNPYDRGIVKNIKEVFSKPPPSLVNFREPVTTEDNSILECVASRFSGDVCSLGKVKGGVVGMTSEDKSLPYILQNLDYSGFKNDLTIKERGSEPGFIHIDIQPNDCSVDRESSIEDGSISRRTSLAIHQG